MDDVVCERMKDCDRVLLIALLLVDERSVMDGGERPGWPEAREREEEKKES